LKDKLIETRATPPYFIQADLKQFELRELGCKFDLIYIDPPWEEYARWPENGNNILILSAGTILAA